MSRALREPVPTREREDTEERCIYLFWDFFLLFILNHFLNFHHIFFSDVDYLGADSPGLKKRRLVVLLKAMVAYDELGSLVPIKRTLQVIDYQNQANKESEVRFPPCISVTCGSL